MVENRPLATAISHLRAGARRADRRLPAVHRPSSPPRTRRERSCRCRCRCCRATHLVENYRLALVRHERQRGSHGAGGPHDDRSAWSRRWSSRIGKIAISLLSAFAIVYFRFPLRMFFFWMIFVTLMLPVEVRIVPDLQGGVGPGHAQHLRRPDGAADRLGHGHLPVPPVLPDRARRTGGGRAHRRRRADALLQGRAAAAVAAPASRRCS